MGFQRMYKPLACCFFPSSFAIFSVYQAFFAKIPRRNTLLYSCNLIHFLRKKQGIFYLIFVPFNRCVPAWFLFNDHFSLFGLLLLFYSTRQKYLFILFLSLFIVCNPFSRHKKRGFSLAPFLLCIIFLKILLIPYPLFVLIHQDLFQSL